MKNIFFILAILLFQQTIVKATVVEEPVAGKRVNSLGTYNLNLGVDAYDPCHNTGNSGNHDDIYLSISFSFKIKDNEGGGMIFQHGNNIVEVNQGGQLFIGDYSNRQAGYLLSETVFEKCMTVSITTTRSYEQNCPSLPYKCGTCDEQSDDRTGWLRTETIVKVNGASVSSNWGIDNERDVLDVSEVRIGSFGGTFKNEPTNKFQITADGSTISLNNFTWSGDAPSPLDIDCTACSTEVVPFSGNRYACENYTLDGGLGSVYDWKRNGAPISSNKNKRYLNVTSSGVYTLVKKKSTSCPEQTGEISILIREISVSNAAINVGNGKAFIMPNVLSVSATTFSDSWLMEENSSITAIDTKNSFENSKRGVWRANESYVYKNERKTAITDELASKPNLQEDGVINSVKMFSWDNLPEIEIEQRANGWQKVNTITRYNSYGFELENKDILGRYSGAIYGYSGQLAVAVGANAKNTEMAFTSFEMDNTKDVDGNTISYTPKGEEGNFNFFSETEKKTIYFDVSGNNEFAILDIPYEEASAFKTCNIVGRKYEKGRGYFHIQSAEVWTVCRHLSDPSKSILNFTAGREFSTLGKWFGKIAIDLSSANNELTGAIEIIDSPLYSSHTGKKALSLLSETFSIKQNLLQLTASKKYVFSTWVKVLTPDLEAVNMPVSYQSKPSIINKLGVKLSFGEDEEEVMLQPSGNIIEGWQKIEGVFEYPSNASEFVITLQRGGNEADVSAYFDDFRLFPANGNLQTYVYDPVSFRLQAVLDNNNYATLYYYDAAGNLFLVKKETIDGIQTIQESKSYQVKK